MQLDLTGTLICMDTGESIQVTGLLDSGATGSTIDKILCRETQDTQTTNNEWTISHSPIQIEH
jgi:hypothetical protein